MGAGAVGATCANVMACREVASEVVLIDIKEGLSEGKMLDMYQCSTLMDFDTKLVGVTNDYKQTANSDVVVITSGIPRKPGMTREELIGTNANIMKGVIENVVKYSPRAIIIVVANPMDTLTYLALKASGLPKNRIIGMGGALDSTRGINGSDLTFFPAFRHLFPALSRNARRPAPAPPQWPRKSARSPPTREIGRAHV